MRRICRPHVQRVGLALLALLTVSAGCSSSDDKGMSAKASDEIATVGDEALGLLRKEAAALGQMQLSSVTDQIKPYADAIGSAGHLVEQRAKEVADSDFNVFVYAALSWAGLKASPVSADQSVTVPALLAEADDRKIRNQDREELTDDARRLLEWIGLMVLFSEKGITDQLVPADSMLRNDWDTDRDGRIDVPLPPIRSGSDGKAWQDFNGTLLNLPATERIRIAEGAARTAADTFEFQV